jgi:hypothetical protein
MRIGTVNVAQALTATVPATMLASLTLLALLTLFAGACSGGFFRQYEYEEDMYLALDGSATVYVNSSVAALNALRGTTLDASPNTPVDRDAVRKFFTTPATRVVGSIKTSRARKRRFAHVRIEIDDVRRLGEVAPFAWSTYQFGRDGELFAYRQAVGSAVAKSVSSNWTGNEVVAFRMHLPSKIEYHNAGPSNLRRGNILIWEQPLADRLKGTPLVFETRVQTQSILYRTVWLFGVTGIAVALMFVVAVWLIVRRGGKAVPST